LCTFFRPRRDLCLPEHTDASPNDRAGIGPTQFDGERRATAMDVFSFPFPSSGLCVLRAPCAHVGRRGAEYAEVSCRFVGGSPWPCLANHKRSSGRHAHTIQSWRTPICLVGLRNVQAQESYKPCGPAQGTKGLAQTGRGDGSCCRRTRRRNDRVLARPSCQECLSHRLRSSFHDLSIHNRGAM
jgi:hypothetical protein